MKNAFALLGLLLMFSCHTPEWVQQTDYSKAYASALKKPVIQYRLFHFSDDSSALFMHIDLPAGVSVCPSFALHYYYYDSHDESVINDSGSFHITTPAPDPVFHVQLKNNTQGYLRLILIYQNSYTKDFQFLFVDKFNRGNQFFNYDTQPAGLPAYIIQPKAVHVSYYDKTVTTLYVTRSEPIMDGPSPAPFFSVNPPDLSLRTDTAFQVANGGTFTANKPGVYQVEAHNKDLNGLTLFCFYDDYPLVNTFKEMAVATRYITKNQEFNKMNKEGQEEIQIDSFWLSRTGQDESVSKNMIKLYYNRVQRANELFTSYKQGWQTDRGMIYIMYGEPDNVTFDGDAETWVYTQQHELPEMTFVFKREENPLTLFDYRLKRNPAYYDSWRVTSYKWRRGLVN